MVTVPDGVAVGIRAQVHLLVQILVQLAQFCLRQEHSTSLVWGVETAIELFCHVASNSAIASGRKNLGQGSAPGVLQGWVWRVPAPSSLPGVASASAARLLHHLEYLGLIC